MEEFNLGLGIYAFIITVSALHYITKLRKDNRRIMYENEVSSKLLNFQKKILKIQADMIRKINTESNGDRP